MSPRRKQHVNERPHPAITVAKPIVKYKEHISINWQNASQKIASAKIKKFE